MLLYQAQVQMHAAMTAHTLATDAGDATVVATILRDLPADRRRQQFAVELLLAHVEGDERKLGELDGQLSRFDFEGLADDIDEIAVLALETMFCPA